MFYNLTKGYWMRNNQNGYNTNKIQTWQQY